MSAAQFPVIAGPDDPRWGEAMRRGRIEANAVLSAIRQKLSQSGRGRDSVPLELARATERDACVQAVGKSASMSLDGIAPCESGETGIKTDGTESALRAGDSLSPRRAARPAEGASATVEHDCASGGRRGEKLPARDMPHAAPGAVGGQNAIGGAQDSISA